MSENIFLGSEDKAFTQGGNRLCFINPHDSNQCIKVARIDRKPAIKRQEKGLIGRLKPLDHFDENLQELHVYNDIATRIGPEALTLIPHCYGLIETNLGLGLCSEMIIDNDKKISISLKQYLWQQGKTPELLQAIDHFKTQWLRLGMPSRNLLLHNIVVQQKHTNALRLVVIDGLGWPGLFTLANYFLAAAQKKAARKLKRFDIAIDQLLEKKKIGGDWGYHGWLDEEQREISS